MSRWERTGKRDLAFNQWHRHALGDWASVIDIDFCEYCSRCGMPLALIEAARDISGQGYFKPCRVTRSLAELAGISAYTVLWKPVEGLVTPEHGLGFIESARLAKVYPEQSDKMRYYTESELRRWYKWLHHTHRCAK